MSTLGFIFFSDCDSVLIPPTEGKALNKTVETCPRCQCKYEARNTTTIKVRFLLQRLKRFQQIRQ